jgi:hypothetical protein
VQTKAYFDKATTNNGATPAFAVAWKGRTDTMQELVNVFGKVEPQQITVLARVMA